jgi:hypothetical protein
MKLASWIPEYWNDQQRAIWKNLEDHWQCLLDGKVEDFLKYIHPEFIGFGHESPLPVDLPWLQKWVGFWAQNTKFLICELRPINIKVHEDIAIIQYCIFTIEQTPGDKGRRSIRRYTMTWKKQANRWVVIASHNNLMTQGLDV